MILMLSMHMIVYIKVAMSQQLCAYTGCKTFSNVFTIQVICPLLPLLALTMQRFYLVLKTVSCEINQKNQKQKHGLPWPSSCRMLQIWLLTSKGHVGIHSQHSMFNMFHLQILVPLTGPASHLQKAYNNHQLNWENPNVGIARENTSKRTAPQPLNKVPPKIQIHKGKTA